MLLYGIDVSNWQGVIDWSQVNANPEVAFVYGLVSDGNFRGMVNGSPLSIVSAYQRNKTLCTKPFSGYHFARFGLDPLVCATAFVTDCGPDCQLPPALDVEEASDNANFSLQQVVDWVGTWLNVVEKLDGRKPVIYNGAFYKGNGIAKFFPNNPWWLPSYPANSKVNPDPTQYSLNVNGNRPCDVWQYTSRGSIPGISGYVDRNVVDLRLFSDRLLTVTEPQATSFIAHCDASTSSRMKVLFGPDENFPNLAFQCFSDGTMRQITGDEVTCLNLIFKVPDIGFRDDSLWNLFTLKSRDTIASDPTPVHH